MFGDRQEFDMGEAHVDAVGDEPCGHFVPGQHRTIIAALPGGRMDLVDRDRLAALIDACPVLAMCFVFPGLHEFRRGDRGVLRTHLGTPRKGVGLQRLKVAMRSDDFELVGRAGADVRGEDLPDAGVAAKAHDVTAAVPVVEVADDGDAAGIRCPDGKVEAVDALMLDRMGAHLVEEAQMRAFADEIVVHRPEDRPEAVRVGHGPFGVAAGRAITDRQNARQLDRAGEEARIVMPDQFTDLLAREIVGDNGFRAWDETARHMAGARLVHAEKGEGIAVAALDDCLNFCCRRCVRRRFVTAPLR